MEGFLEKWCFTTCTYERRYVVLCPTKHLLVYFNSDEISDINHPCGKLSLMNVMLNLEQSEGLAFSIVTESGEELRLRAPDVGSRNAWIERISAVSERAGSVDFPRTQLCLAALRDANEELREALSSLDQPTELEPELEKFSLLLDDVGFDIEKMQCHSELDISASRVALDDNSLDIFMDCEGGSPSSEPLASADEQDTNEYDKESEYEEDEVTMTTSVLSHLLSQVKIGMDLTKITLPTFILERRSLLEMYGDFFARPFNLIKFTQQKDPKDRFLGALKFYLASFYPGRRGKVSKKPYNPILGEKFLCFYKCNEKRNDFPENEGGPLSWAKTCDLSFVAEQVSHHPPISAFYAECPTARVSCNAYIYTKSRFLGISVAVQNIGKGVATLHEFGEDYEFTFPTGYGRSIFSVPWLELGGSCSLICEKTGYQANIEFLCKPFFNNKKHRVQVEIYEINSKKHVAAISGDWNGSMFISEGDEKKRPFINSHHEAINRKYVRPQPQQDLNESRIIWHNVSEALKEKDINEATNHKHQLEERQRREANERTTKWIPKYFSSTEAEGWVYNSPLSRRL